MTDGYDIVHKEEFMEKSTVRKTPLVVTCLIIIGILVALDQWTKASVVDHIPLYEKVVIIPGFFDLTYVQNTGAAFSFFDGIGMWFFILLTICALGAMVYYFFKAKEPGIEFCLALIAAGAIGNLIDRMSLGYVRDFFLFYIFGSPFPVFNVADICITVGFILLIVLLFANDWKEHHKYGKNRE